MKNLEKMNVVRRVGSRFGGLGLALLASAAVLAPGCKFESCADTNSCGPEDEESLGGQGGAGEMEDPDNTPNGTGGEEMVDEMLEGMGGDGASANGTGGEEPVLTCDGDEVVCAGKCIDPSSDAQFCGAEGACEGDEVGQACQAGEICVDGGCELDCEVDEVACDGSCVDPLTNDDYCGADAECQGFSACSARQQCVAGGCAGWGDAGTVNFGTGSESLTSPGQLAIDSEGVVDFAWARSNESDSTDVRTSRFIVDPGIWSQPEVRDTEATFASHLKMQTNQAGRAVLIWEQMTNGAETIWSSIREPGADWTVAAPISGESSGGEATLPAFESHFALDEDGNAYAVWQEYFSGNLVVSSLKAGDISWGVPTFLELNAPKPWDLRGLSIESLENGEALVVVENGAADGWTWYSTVSEDGVFGIAEPAFDATQEGASLSPVVASNEEEAVLFWVAGTDQGTALDFGMVSFFRDGVWSEPTEIRTPGTVAPLREPRIAIDADGNITVAWISGTETEALWSASLEAGAEEWTFQEEAVAVGVGAQSLKEVSLALDGLGNVQLAWIQMAGTADSVWATRLRAGSSDFDVPRVVEDWESIPVSGLSMDFNEAGQGVITWWTAEQTERTLGVNYFR